jgi:hypothetical protein
MRDEDMDGSRDAEEVVLSLREVVRVIATATACDTEMLLTD